MTTPRALPEGLPLLLAFDLDGTLIPDQGREVPPASVAALTRLRRGGVRVAIITGRDTAPRPVREAVQPDAIATNNGGRIEVGEELHAEARFTPAELEAVLAHELEDARVVVFTPDTLYIDLPPGREPEPWMLLRSWRPLAEAPSEGVLKVGFYHPEVRDFAARLRDKHPGLVVTGAQPPYDHFLTVTPVGAHKGAALTLIAGALGIPLERTVVFGDSDNDEAMFELAGYAVQLGSLPLLARHAHAQVAGPEALGAFLDALADRLEGKTPEPQPGGVRGGG